MNRVFTALAVASMANLLALAGVVGYAGSKHWLSKDRLRRAIEVLKGEEKEPLSANAKMPAAKESPTGQATEPKRPHSDEMDDVTRTELGRRTREIQDGWKLLETQQLALVRDRESLDQEKSRLVDEERKRAEGGGDGGQQKEVGIFAGLKAKQAKELLRAKPDADALGLLKAMEERQVRKIVGECKSEEERQWIGRILEQMSHRAVTQAEVLSAGT